MAVIPLGTGNDLSRAFGWGPAFNKAWIKGHGALYKCASCHCLYVHVFAIVLQCCMLICLQTSCALVGVTACNKTWIMGHGTLCKRNDLMSHLVDLDASV